MSFFYHSTGISKWCRLSMIANLMKPQEYFLNTIKVIVTLIYCLIKLMYNWMLLLFIRLLVFIVLFKFMYQSIFFWRGMCMDWCYVKELYEWDEIYLCIVIYFAFNSGPLKYFKKYIKNNCGCYQLSQDPFKRNESSSFATLRNRRKTLSDGWYNRSLNCRKRQLRPQHQRLLGNCRKFATLLTVAISHFKGCKMRFFL